MAFNPANIANAFIEGRQARQQYDYGQTRNAMADLDLQNAPTEIANRNALTQQNLKQGELQTQGAQMDIDTAKAQQGHARLRQALDSGNPKAYVLEREPDLVAQLKQHGVDLATVDDEQATQIIDGLAREYAGKAGIAPVQTIEGPNGSVIQRDLGTNAVKQVIAPVRPDHFAEAEAGRNARSANSGGTNGSYVVMTPEEVATAGLPKGTVAQKNGAGKINVIKKPDASGGGQKLSEGDKRARVTFNSILNAEKDLAKIDGVDSSNGTQLALGSTALTRGLQSDEYRKYQAAGKRWAANLLYLKSGATATPDEINSTWAQFFPQFGDGEGAKKEKAAARLQELNGIADVYGLDKTQIPGGRQAPDSATANGGTTPITIASDQEYDQLPLGTEFIGPDGQRRRKQ
jgi:hypothetical protein